MFEGNAGIPGGRNSEIQKPESDLVFTTSPVEGQRAGQETRLGGTQGRASPPQSRTEGHGPVPCGSGQIPLLLWADPPAPLSVGFLLHARLKRVISKFPSGSNIR